MQGLKKNRIVYLSSESLENNNEVWFCLLKVQSLRCILVMNMAFNMKRFIDGSFIVFEHFSFGFEIHVYETPYMK